MDRHKGYLQSLCRWTLAFVVVVDILTTTHASQPVVLVAGQRLPYIAESLPNNGYVFEVAFEAFKRVGYDLEVNYYPIARATKLAQEGKVTGLLPVYYSQHSASKYWLSDPFAGDQIGLLKKTTNQNDIIIQPKLSVFENLQGLSQFQFGLVRGGQIEGVVAGSISNNKHSAVNDLQNIDMLMAERMDFAIIDKYTAGDLIISQRPHLIGKLEFIYPALTTQHFHVAFSKLISANQELYEKFNIGLRQIKQDGTLELILSKHGFFNSPAMPIAESKKVPIVIGTVNNPDMLVMQKLSSQFEAEHPNISLNWRVLGESTLRQRLLSDLAISDGQFDVMTIGAYEAPIWAELDWLTPIQDLPINYDLDDILEPVRKALSYNGHLYGLPFNAESSVLYYRTDLFESAGLIMPEAPTYDEILGFAASLHKPQDNHYGICLRAKGGWGENMALVTTMVNAFGGRWFDEKWQPQLNTQAWTKAISMYVKLVENYGPPQPTKNGFNENLALFSQGKCAMWIDATLAAGKLFNPKSSLVSQTTGLANAPISITAKGSQWLWSWSLGIPKSSRHKAQALKFITWATSKQYIQLVGESEGMLGIPSGTRKSSYLNEDYIQAAPFSSRVLEAIVGADVVDSTLQPKPYIGIQYVAIKEFPAIGNQIGLLLEKVLLGEISIRKALEQGQKLTEKQMKASNYY